MRRKLLLTVALIAVLVVPATAFGAAPDQTSKQDVAIANFQSESGSQCLILTLYQGHMRPVGGVNYYLQELNLDLLDHACNPAAGSEIGQSAWIDLSGGGYRIIGTDAAYVVTSGTVGGHALTIDVAWVATGPAMPYSEDHSTNSFIGKEASAHVSGAIIDATGTVWEVLTHSNGLRSLYIAKNF